MPLYTFLTRMVWYCVLPLLALAVYLAANNVISHQQKVDREAASVTQSASTVLDHDLWARISALQVLASSPLVDNPLRRHELYLEAQGFKNSFGGHVILADLSKQMLFNTRVPFGSSLPKLPTPKGQAAAPKALATGKPSVGDMFIGPIANEPLVAVVVPIIRNEQVQGLLLSIFGVKHFQQRLDNVVLPDNWSMKVLDGQKEVIAGLYPTGDLVITNRTAQPKVFSAALNLAPWSIAVEIPQNIYHAPLISTALAMILAILTLTLFSVLVGRFASRRLSRSLATLTMADPPTDSQPSILEVEKIRTILDDLTTARMKEEILFRVTFEQAAVGVALVSIEGHWLSVNKKLCEIVGYSPEELLTKTFQEMTYPEDLETNLKNVQQMLAGEIKTYSTEKRYYHKNGSIVWINLTVSLVRDEEGQPAYFISIINDITAMKQAENVILASRKQLRFVTDHAPVLIAHCDSDRRYKFINQPYADFFGLKTADIIGKHPREVLGEAAYAAAATHMADVLTGSNVEFDLVLQNPAGKVHAVHANYVPERDDSGQVVGFIAAITDITERKQAEAEHLELERQLRQKYKMETVGVMAGGMAHNFNNNLSIILGNLELTKMKLTDRPEIDELIDHAKIAVLRSRDLVKQIMTYSRKDEQHKIPLQLSAAIDEVVTLLKATIPSSVHLQQNLSPDSISTYIQANASQIQEILLNLCNNAVHAMEEQGKLSITLDTVELKQHQIPAHSLCKPGSYLHLRVQDTGCGITPELQNKIFDPFFTTKEMHEGTGMGLSTVQGLMDQFQGMIHVDSQIGKGTTFHLYFPVIEATVDVSSDLAAGNLPRGTEHILLVDDDEMLAKMTQTMLTEMGYQVTMMTDSQEALQFFTTNADSIQLVITDQTMPGLTGKDLIQGLKQINPDIPTILCTGYSSKVDEDKARGLGISAFLIKPIGLPKLLQTVRRALNKE